MRRIGKIGEDHPRIIADNACLSLSIEGGGVLMRTDGSVSHLKDHRQLLDIQIKSGDAYIVGPHGEIVPFLAQAADTGAIPLTGNRLLHIDAHFDNRRRSPDKSGYQFDSDQNSLRLARFLDRGYRADHRQVFDELIAATLGDIETFLATIASINQLFAAFIRQELQKGGFITGPMLPQEYIEKCSNPRRHDLEIEDIIRGMHPTIYSMDADILGAFRECFSNSAEDAKLIMLKMIRQIFEGMNAEIELRRNAKHSEGAVYAISVDHVWCTYPERFVQEFIDRFYLQLVRLNTARRSAEMIGV